LVQFSKFKISNWIGDAFFHRRLIVAMGSVLICMIVGCSPLSDRSKELVGSPSPDARLLLIDGPETTLSADHGKFMGVLFWATWCNYSKGAIADFEDLARKYAHRGDVSFVAVSIDKYEDLHILRDRIASQELHSLKHAFSGGDVEDEAYQMLRGDRIPYAVLIDPRGIVRYVGTSTSEMEDILDDRFGR